MESTSHTRTLQYAQPLFERWPGLGFLPLGLLFGWLDVLTMSYTMHSGAETASVDHDLFLLTLTLSIAGFTLLFALAHRAIDRSFAHGHPYPLVAATLSGSIALGILVDSGALPAQLLAVEALLAGSGVAWCFICCANSYARLCARDIFIYVALSKVVGIVVYFLVNGLPIRAFSQCALIVLPLAATALLYVETRLHPAANPAGQRSLRELRASNRQGDAPASRPQPQSQPQGKDRSQNQPWSQNLVLRLSIASFTLFFIAECSKMTMVAPLNPADTASSFELANIVALLLCLALALVVAAFGTTRPALLQTCCFVVVAVMLVLFVAMPLFAERAPELTWFYSAFRTLLDAVLFSLCFVVVKRTQASTSQVYFLICGMHSFGSFAARGLLSMPPLASFFSSAYAILVFDIVASIVLLLIFTPHDLAALVEPNGAAAHAPASAPTPEPAPSPAPAPTGGDLIDEFARSIGLSGRELDVYELLLKGYTLNLIGEELGISPSTVKTHVSKIYLKAGVTTRENLLKARNAHAAAASPR